MKLILPVLALASLLSACSTIPGTSMVDGSKKDTALEFVGAVVSQDTDTVRELANADYIQHNPYLPSGLEPFIGLFPILEENGTAATAVRVIEDGNYVAIHHLWTGAKPFGADEMVSFDILRFDENGKIAEHWDAMMPNMPANASGRTLLDGETRVMDLDQTGMNRKIASRLFDSIINGSPEEVGEVILETFAADYKQHNPDVADGIDAIFEAFPQQQWVYKTNHKLIAEGNFVLSVSEGTAKGVPTVFYDLLRFEDGKAVEHWDVIQTIPSDNLANDNGMFGFR